MPADPVFIPAGTAAAPEDVLRYADAGTRTLDQAIIDADLLVCAPHATAAVPAELAEYVPAGWTRDLQDADADLASAVVAETWARLDPRVLYVANPHARMVDDPDGVMPVERPPAFDRIAAQGADVYLRTRDDLLDRLLTCALRRRSPTQLTVLSLHDGREPDAPVLTLSAVDADGVATMGPFLLDVLAVAHRSGLRVGDEDVVIGPPPSTGGGGEFARIAAAVRADSRLAGAGAAVTVGVVRAEFRRAWLTAGQDGPGPRRAEELALACKTSWDLFRAGMVS